jgi:hypothetical protein
MSLTLKVFFNDEIRRVAVDASAVSNFEYLSEKVRAGLNNQLPKQVVFKWKDAEGDLVTFSTDDELMEALQTVDNGVLKIFVEKKTPKGGRQEPDGAQTAGSPHWPFPGMNPFNMGAHAPGMSDLPHLFGSVGLGGQAVHPGITCDGCQTNPIKGKRFKCGVCPDYDLCQTCKDKGVHSEHEFTQTARPFGHHGRWGNGGGGRCGRGGKRHGGPGGDSEDEKAAAFFTQEDKQNIMEVMKTVTEAAKTSAFEIAGVTAGDCAAQTVGVAVRSSIRRAMILEKTTGMIKRKRHSQGAKDAEDSSLPVEEEDSSTSDSDSDDEQKDIPVNKQIKKKAKAASKKIAKLTRKEVSPRFGKVAGKWAAIAARQSMMQSICQAHRASQRDLAKEERKAAKNGATEETQPEPMEASGDAQNLYPTLTPTAPVIEPTFEIPSEEEIAINSAIQVFCDMGYKPDDWLISHIREAKGSIPAVFEKLKPTGQ